MRTMKPHGLLSLSMIVKNEENFLDDCLRSVQGVADEMVVVDTGSTDKTKEIAVRHGAKVIDFAWAGDFSQARNFSLDHCSGEWILYLDADERLDQRHKKTIRLLIRDRHVSAYNVIIAGDHATEKGSVSQANSYPRLFRNLPGIRFEGRVHEQLWPSLQRTNSIVRQSDVVIHHLGYASGYDVVRDKALRNLELLRRQVFDTPSDAYAWFQIGNTLVVLKQYEPAREPLLKALTLGVDKSVTTSCLNLLAEVELRAGRMEQAIAHLTHSIQLGPKQLMAHWFLALIYSDLKKNEEALQALTVVEKNLNAPASARARHISADLDLRREDVLFRKAQVLENAGALTNALEAYAQLLPFAQLAEPALQGILRCADKSPAESVTVLKRISERVPGSDVLALLLAKMAVQREEFESAITYAEKYLTHNPCHTEAVLLAVQAYSRLGEIQRAEEIYETAVLSGVREFQLYKAGLTLALAREDIAAAFERLELMTRTTTADLSPLKQRIQALAARISGSPAVDVT